MHVAVSGANGLLGRHVVRGLASRGHDVVALVRGAGDVAGAAKTVQWEPRSGIPVGALQQGSALVNVAGANVATRRWTTARRQELLESRVATTRACVAALDSGEAMTLINASAVGYYGSTESTVDETSEPGDGFLARLCAAWEAAATAARGGRVVLARFGVVLARDGGALVPLARLARVGANGPLAGGRQWVSWIHVDDAVAAIAWLMDSDVAGPVNVVAPESVRQREFARELGAAVHRPAVLPLPRLAAELALGRGPASVVVGGQRVLPARLVAAGFAYEQPALRGALSSLLAR